MKLTEPVWLFTFEVAADGDSYPLKGKRAVTAKTYVTAFAKAQRLAIRHWRSRRYGFPKTVEVVCLGKFEVE